MKAVVLEIKNEEAAVLREDGVFETVRGHYSVGDTIEIPDKQPETIPFTDRKNKVTKWIISAAAVIILAASLIGIYSYQNLLVYASVRVEGDVSLEYDINRRGNVIAVHALNEFGEEVAERLNDQGVKNTPLSEVLDRASEIIEEEHFISDGTSPEIHVQVAGGNEERMAEFEEIVKDHYAPYNEQADINETTPQDPATGELQPESGMPRQNAENEQGNPENSGLGSEPTQTFPETMQPDSDPGISQPGSDMTFSGQEPGNDSAFPDTCND